MACSGVEARRGLVFWGAGLKQALCDLVHTEHPLANAWLLAEFHVGDSPEFFLKAERADLLGQLEALQPQMEPITVPLRQPKNTGASSRSCASIWTASESASPATSCSTRYAA